MKTNLNTEETYAEVEKMLYKLAWDAAKRDSLSFEECLSECHWVFMRAISTRYNAARGMKFSSFVYQSIQWRFLTLRHRKLREDTKMPTEELNEETAGAAPPLRSACLEVVDGLSEDAREIVSLLLDTPKELSAEITTPKQLLSAVRRYLLQRGWDRRTWDDSHEEIEQAFRLVWRDGKFA